MDVITVREWRALHNPHYIPLFSELALFDYLTCRKGDSGHRTGQDPEAGRPMHRTPGLPRVPFLRRWDWLGVHLTPHGASLRRLRQEVQAGILHLPSATGRSHTALVLTHFERVHRPAKPYKPAIIRELNGTGIYYGSIMEF